MVTQQQDVAS